MRKVIKIGFPILCVAVIGGTFILLNKTTDRINRNKLHEDEIEEQAQSLSIIEKAESVQNIADNTNIVDSEDIKAQEIKNKARAIEIVKEQAPSISNSYYTNEGTDNGKYLVAIRENETKLPKIYYAVDIVNEKIEIYVK